MNVMPALVAGIHVFLAFHDLLKLKTWITDKPRPRLCQYRARRDSAVDVEALFGARPEANKIDIGFDLRRGSTLRDVPEEALMLTGDENLSASTSRCCGRSSRTMSAISFLTCRGQKPR